jgi:hypothetical protein
MSSRLFAYMTKLSSLSFFFFFFFQNKIFINTPKLTQNTQNHSNFQGKIDNVSSKPSKMTKMIIIFFFFQSNKNTPINLEKKFKIFLDFFFLNFHTQVFCFCFLKKSL